MCEVIDEVREILQDYNGEITETETEIKISSNNKICCYYENGKIAKEKVVPCEIGYGKLYHNLFGTEKTYEIIGGFSIGYSKQRLIDELKRYNFSKKDNLQLSFI